ncbi:MAG: Superoxide dismutase, partial [Thermoleophilia bacterium]|nr:Superoxide dismutase [Thermoleophilia bacterium]
QLYFDHLGGDGAAPTGWLADAIDKQWGSFDKFKADLKATAIAGRGWAWLAFDWETGKLGTYLGDAQNTFPVWNATPLVALDVYEHAYFADFGTDRPGYIDAFFANLDWNVVIETAEMFEIQKRFGA